MYDFDSPIDRRGTDSVKWMAGDSCRSSVWPDVIPMWVADMDFASPPAVALAVRRRAEHPVYGYSMKTEAFCRSYIDWMASRHGVGVERGWLSFSPGIVPAIATAVRALTSPGDGVAIMPPVYHPFRNMVEKNGRTVVEAPLSRSGGRYGIDLGALDAACARSRLLVLCSPHNPVGRAWTRDELEAVFDIAERRDVIVFSDEIHGDLVYEAGRMVPSLALGGGARKRLVAAWAPSKTFNIAGLQASFIVTPDPAIRARFDAASEATGIGSPNCMAQDAVIAAYNEGGPWLDEALLHMRGNYDALAAGLAARVPGVEAYPLEGTYLAWLDFRGVGLEGDVGPEIVERAGLWLDAGVRFGPGGAGFARMNLGCPRRTVETAVDRLAAAFGPGA